jgi:predicted secreted acid phosphatase
LSTPAALLAIVVLLTVGWREFSAAQSASTPANLGELKQKITEYKRSGAYDRDVAAVIENAQSYIVRRARLVRTPAIILDIDETTLSNWPEIQANDYGRIASGSCNLPSGPCGSTSWVASAQADAIAPTLKLFHAAKASGVSIFFVTGRSETVREATETNLRKAGYDGWTALIMSPQELQPLLPRITKLRSARRLPLRDSRSSPISATSQAILPEEMRNARTSCQIRSTASHN